MASAEMNKKGVLIAGVPSPLSLTPLPFSLFLYPLPLSTPATQAKHWIQYQSLGQVWQRIWKIASSSLVWTKVKVSSFFFFKGKRVAKGKKEDLIHLLHELSANNQSDNTDFVTSVSLLGGVHSFVGS